MIKLNLGCGTDVRDNYINVDINPVNKNVTRGDFKNLDAIGISNGDVESLVAVNILHYLKVEEMGNTLNHWVQKLSALGEIYIEDVDYSVFGNMMANEQLSTEVINQVLFSDAIPTRGIFNLTGMDTFLRKLDLFITEKGYNGHNFYIRAIKQ